MADSDEKIIRNSIEKLKIKITEEEEEYRKKYLPDPTKLTNEKLICTVCNVSLAADIHKGNHIFVHRCLQVLVCETCYNFYGDGCFSSDEDGDDKYCRWCGQGGTLFLCSTCTCTFCQKCVKQNLKQSVVNELEKDDWQCYVCNPRPLFGSRTICWGAQQLNQVAKDKESERLKKRRERQEKIEEKKRQVTERKSRKASESEDETSKKKRKKVSESDSSSPEVLPSKRPRRDTRSLNGSVNKKPLRKKDASSDDESSEKEKKTSKRTRSANKSKAKKYADSSSEDESDFKGRNKSRSKKKISKESSNESSDDNKRKTRRKPAKKSIDNSDISSDEKSSKKTKSTKKKGKYSDVSSDEDTKKKKKKPKRDSSGEESLGSDKKSKHRSSSKKRYVSSEDESDNRSKKTSKKKIVQRKKGSDLDSDNDWSAGKKHSDKTKKHSNEENSSKAKTNDKSTVSNDDLVVKNRIKLAILWLRNAASDIAELGALIIRRTKKFELKKINKENLKTYEDVLKTAGKLKQLINGAQSNYEHIEKNLDAQLKPWKILTGLEEGEKNSPDASRKESSEKDVSKLEIVPGTSPCDLDSKVSDNNCSKILYNETKISADKKQKNDSPNETQDCNLNLQWSENDESDGDDKNSTGALITKASESLDKMDVEEGALFTKASENLDKMDVEEKKLEKGEQEGKENTDTDNQVEVKKLKKSEQGGQENTDTDSQVEADLNPKDENSAPLNLEDENSNKSEIDDSNKKESDLEELESTNGSVKSSYKKLQKNTSQLNKETESTGKKEGKEQKSKISNISSTDEIESDSKDKELPKKNKKEDGSRQKPKENAKSKTGKGREAIKKKRGTSVSKTHKDLEEIEDGSGSSQDSLSFEKFSRGLEEKWHRNFETRKTEEDSSNHSVSKNKTKETTPKKNLKENKLKVEKETEKLSSNKNTKSATCKSTEEKRNESKTHAGKIKIQKEIEKEQLGNIEDEKDNVKCEILSEKSGNSEDEHLEKEENEQDESCVNKTTENMECESVLKEKENGEDVKKEIQTFENGDGISNTKTRKPDSKLKTDDVEKKYEWLDSSTEEIESRDKEIPSKTKGLSSTDEEEAMKKSQGKQKVLKKKSTLNRRTTRNLALLESSDEENEHEKEKKTTLHSESSDEDRNPKENKDDGSLSGSVVNLSSAESSDSDIFVEKKRKDKTKKKSDSEGEEESGDKKPKKKRKLIRCKTSSDESGKSGDENLKTSKKSKQGESPGKGGRKNIKKIKKGYDLEQATKEAGEEEKERRKRIEERQKLFNQVFDIKETKKLDKLVLDFDPDSKKELLSVDKDLVTKMKPHQAKGVKFMWDSCFESISQLKKKSGSGCILAHCMGLGKTFQVISLVHTLLMHEETQVRTVMVVCPLSTVLNWYNEFSKWLEDVEGGDSIDVYHLTKSKKNIDRARELRHWQDSGGVLIIGYDMFRNLTSETVKRLRAKIKKDFQETLVDPGADLIVCDEGHMLKNEATALSKAMSKVKTLRRIVLTGTPMQNNLKEYHCMVQFVKPNLLGTRKEFLNRFVNPITNGQFVDSTDSDVKVMKRRAHVLHKMLEGLVQRFDYNVLTPFLPPKHEYVISVSLSELQVKLYQHYLENYSQKSDNNKAGSRLFQDWQALGRIWTHPRVLKMSTERENYKKMMAESDEEGSLKDFIDDGNDDESSESPSNDSDNSSGGSIKSVDGKKSKGAPVRRATRSTRSSNKTNDAHLQSSGEEDNIVEQEELSDTKGAWWSELIEPKHMDDINQSGKLALLFAILKECETIEDKVLVFSQSLFSLDLIEYFLDKIDCATQENRLEEHLGNYQGNWSRGLDYFRLDGSTSSENRSIWCKAFNREDNPRARLFLISTRAGGLGINLTGANRVIIFDASWNPSHDVQSIFRIYRFGQKKPCYIYRFIAHGTMEEKVYDRQVAKQSMSNRVIDEQQVHRHFSSNDLNELYSFTPPSKTEDKETPALPKDVLMAEILGQFRDWIEKYHEHDSLLENVEEEELNEEERKLAWEDYENDKKRGFMPASTGNTFTGPGNFMSAQIEIMKRNLEAKYPEKSPEEIQTMLVIQVSDLMRKQQQQQLMLRQQQAAAQAAQMQTNAIAQGFGKLTQEQLFNLQVLQMKQQQNANAYLNLYQSNMAKLQMNQVRQQVPQNVFSQRFQQLTNLQGQSHLSNLLSVPQPFSTNVQLQQQANASTAQKIQLERMKQSYLTNNQNSSDGKTSKVPDEKKTSKS